MTKKAVKTRTRHPKRIWHDSRHKNTSAHMRLVGPDVYSSMPYMYHKNQTCMEDLKAENSFGHTCMRKRDAYFVAHNA